MNNNQQITWREILEWERGKLELARQTRQSITKAYLESADSETAQEWRSLNQERDEIKAHQKTSWTEWASYSNRRRKSAIEKNLEQLFKTASHEACRDWRRGVQLVQARTPQEIAAFNDVYEPFFRHVPEEAQTIDGFNAAIERNADPAFQKGFGSFEEFFFTLQHQNEAEPLGIANFGIYDTPLPSGEFDIGIYSIYTALKEPHRGLGLVTRVRDFQIQTALDRYEGAKNNIKIMIAIEPNNPEKLTPATYAMDAYFSVHAVARVASWLRTGFRKINMDYQLCPLDPEKGPCDYLDLRVAVVNAKRDLITGDWSWTIERPDSIATADLQEFYRRTQGTNVLGRVDPENDPAFIEGQSRFKRADKDGRIPFVDDQNLVTLRQRLDKTAERLSTSLPDVYEQLPLPISDPAYSRPSSSIRGILDQRTMQAAA